MNFQWALNITCVLLLTGNLACEKQPSYGDVLVYGHAGTTLYPERWVYPPNTLEAVTYALDVLHADGVEVDVQMTKDSVLVLYHDAFLDQHTKLSGCIATHNFNELQTLNVYRSSYSLTRLDEVTAFCMSRDKKIFLDLKPYDYCSMTNIDYQTFNRSLNQIILAYTPAQRATMVVNTRNEDLLEGLSDTAIIKCFETENSSLGIEKCTTGQADELCFSYAALTAETMHQLNDAGIKITIFGTKTQAEIEAGLGLAPFRIITDNIAYTRKRVK